MQITCHVQGAHGSFNYTADSIESALETAEWLATGKASSTTPTKEPEAKKPDAKPASSPNTAKPASSAKKEPVLAKETPSVTFDQVRDIILEVAEKKKGDITRAMMARFGVKKGQELKEDQWPHLIEMATKILAGELNPLDSCAQDAPAEEFA